MAGVLYNRLKAGMRLDIDATTQYAIGEWKAELTAEDLATRSPYNTRLYAGLPPGPDLQPRPRRDRGRRAAGAAQLPLLRGPQRRHRRPLLLVDAGAVREGRGPLAGQRRRMIDGTTRVAGIIGWPVEHSLSPAMHNAAFRALGPQLDLRGLPGAPGPGAPRPCAAWPRPAAPGST